MVSKLGRLLPLLLIMGCYGPKKAEKALEKAYKKQPVTFAKKANELFPIVTDSVKYVEWREKTDSIFLSVTDTIYHDSIQVREIIRNNYKVITRLKEHIRTIPPIIKADSAAIFKLNEYIKKAEKSKQYYKKKSEILFWIALLLTAFGVIFLLRRK